MLAQKNNLEGILKHYLLKAALTAPKKLINRTLQKVLSNPPSQVLSNPWKGSIEPLKRFYRTPKGSIQPPFGPWKGSIESQLKGLQNHRKGSIEPFAFSRLPPFQVTLLQLKSLQAEAPQDEGGSWDRSSIQDQKTKTVSTCWINLRRGIGVPGVKGVAGSDAIPCRKGIFKQPERIFWRQLPFRLS